MHAIASGKKAKLLENARETIERAIGGTLRVHSKPKHEDGSQQVDALVTILKEKCTKIGACSKELNEGNLMQTTVEKLGGKEQLSGRDVRDRVRFIEERPEGDEIRRRRREVVLGGDEVCGERSGERD